MTKTREIPITVTITEPEPQYELEEAVRRACARMIDFVGRDPRLTGWYPIRAGQKDDSGGWTTVFSEFVTGALREEGHLRPLETISMYAWEVPQEPEGNNHRVERIFPALLLGTEEFKTPGLVPTRHRQLALNAPADLLWRSGRDIARADGGRYVSWNPFWMERMEWAVQAANCLWMEKPNRLELLDFSARLQGGFVQAFCRAVSRYRATLDGTARAQGTYNEQSARFDRAEAAVVYHAIEAAEGEIARIEANAEVNLHGSLDGNLDGNGDAARDGKGGQADDIRSEA